MLEKRFKNLKKISEGAPWPPPPHASKLRKFSRVPRFAWNPRYARGAGDHVEKTWLENGGGQINGSQNEYTPLYVRLSIGPKVTLSAYEGT